MFHEEQKSASYRQPLMHLGERRKGYEVTSAAEARFVGYRPFSSRVLPEIYEA